MGARLNRTWHHRNFFLILLLVPDEFGSEPCHLARSLQLVKKLVMSRVVENPHFDESGRPYLEEQAAESDSSSILRDRVVAKEKNKSGRGEQRYVLLTHHNRKNTPRILFALSSPTSRISLAESNCLNLLVPCPPSLPGCRPRFLSSLLSFRILASADD
jgi:hypothetical protein